MARERYRIEEIPEEVRGRLCAECGKCCKVLILDGLAIDRRTHMDRSYLDFIELHGGTNEIVRDADGVSLTMVLPTPCQKLANTNGTYTCSIYKKRPLVCREYSCLEDVEIGDTAWKRYIREQRRNASRRSRRSGRDRSPEARG